MIQLILSLANSSFIGFKIRRFKNLRMCVCFHARVCVNYMYVEVEREKSNTKQGKKMLWEDSNYFVL